MNQASPKTEPAPDVGTIKVTIESTVDHLWLEHCLGTDVFRRAYSGYWANGVEWDQELGWLMFEHGGETRGPADAPDAIMKAWRDGCALPERWHRLSKAVAVAAWAEGVKRGGVEWFENGDGRVYDAAVQMAVLGEIRYA